MKKVFAIARLTFAEGVRMRVVLIFVIVLVFLMLRMPFALKGDETLAGRLQNFLSYSLGSAGVLLSVATIFLACATLTREFQTRSLHLVVTKPVARFQILLGKWLGVMALSGMLLALCGAAIYAFALFIKNQPEEFRRDRVKINEVVWTSRMAATPTPPDFTQLATEYVESRVKDGNLTIRSDADKREHIRQRERELEADWLSVPRGGDRVYQFENLEPPVEGAVYQLRFKARGIPLPVDEILTVRWLFVDPTNGAPLMPAPFETKERSAVEHQFLVNAKQIVREGKAALVVINPWNPQSRTRISFDTANDLQLLYRVGPFEPNYLKALAFIFLRLTFLAAVALFFGTFVSFPVACFCVFSLYLFCLGMPWWIESIGGNLQLVNAKIDPYGAFGPYIRTVLMPILQFAIPDFTRYDGGDELIDGIYISDARLLLAAAHTLLFGGIVLLLPGWLIFRGREVAGVQV